MRRTDAELWQTEGMVRKKKEVTTEPEFDIFEGDDYADLSLSQQKALIEFFKNNGRIVATCRAAKITRATWYNWKNNDEQFKRALKEMVLLRRDELEAAMHEFAFAGDSELIKFLMKAYDRALYDDAFARQERAFEKGAMPADVALPVRALLVRDVAPGEKKEDES